MRKKFEKELIDMERKESETEIEYQVRVYTELNHLQNSRKVENQFQMFKDYLRMMDQIKSLKKQNKKLEDENFDLKRDMKTLNGEVELIKSIVSQSHLK